MSAAEARQERLLADLSERGLAALIVTEPANVRYLTGYVGSNGVALIGTGGRVLLTDSRYAVSATEQVRGAEVVIGKRDLLADVASRIGDVAAGGAIVSAMATSPWGLRAVVADPDGRAVELTEMSQA